MHYQLSALALLLSFSSLASANPFDVTDFGAIANDGLDDSSAFQDALDQLSNGDILTIPSGEYQICRMLHLKQKNDITISGVDGSHLKKCTPFAGEYLLHIAYTQNLTLQSIHFEGINNGNQQPVWGEQGIYLGSTKGSRIIHNQFNHFGDAGLRITTASNDHSNQPGSTSIIVRGNKFKDCAQVTTTQATSGTEKAGTQNILIDNNQFIGCKLKLSARAETRGAKVTNNTFADINGTANEVSYYSDVSYFNNKFDNILGFAINIYPNPRTTKEIQWGNISIIGNTFDTIQQGIRLQSFGKKTIAKQPIKNIQIEKNIFNNIHFKNGKNKIEDQYKAIIRTTTQDSVLSFDHVQIQNNHYNLTPSSQFLSIDNKTTNITIENNSEK
ncbi:glycoside hydrolase family 55 protein [Vibrio sp. HDW18]|uniref:glycoside hydrolase family 55 protein n=1 Tax=Vibrio sp. HDW18 TaxID=2714948 RepID=UPI001F0F0614|nr:glycoside hydrolase family 55 protein [Vibrio sp. HDW18]